MKFVERLLALGYPGFAGLKNLKFQETFPAQLTFIWIYRTCIRAKGTHCLFAPEMPGGRIALRPAFVLAERRGMAHFLLEKFTGHF